MMDHTMATEVQESLRETRNNSTLSEKQQEVMASLRQVRIDDKQDIDVDEIKQYSYRYDKEFDASRHHLSERRRSSLRQSIVNTQHFCCPKPVVIIEALPLYLSLVALILTHAGSWSCTYFDGAEIAITGGYYGLWTLQDVYGKCQLWDVLFFSYHWDSALEGARFLSMVGMLVGLAMFTTMLQAQQAHYLSLAFAFGLTVLFVVSLATSSIFNIWIVFWLSTFIIFTLIVRSLFVHPVFRRISNRGSTVIGCMLVLCFASTLCTLSVLKSDYCTCARISTRDLEDRIRDDSTCRDDGSCRLASAGYIMIVASLFWLGAAVSTFIVGVQPSFVHEDPAKLHIQYAGYSRDSITTKVLKLLPKRNPAAGCEHNSKKNLENETRAEVEHADNIYIEDANADIQKIAFEDGTNALSNLGVDNEDANMEGRFNNDHSKQVDGDVQRTWCQRLCCDFRVTERTEKERRLFWGFRILLGFMVVIYMFLIILLIGSRWENRQAEEAPSTSHFFVTDVVCAFNETDPSAPFLSFSTRAQAQAAGFTVAHCGDCAFCSNMPDIETYVQTRTTIAKTAKECGMKAIFGKFDELVECLENKIGFTRPCTSCWAINMRSTAKHCLFTCMKTLFTGFMSNNNVPGSGDTGWLNHCLQCDEKRSGPGFVTCSGVARRRLGITSEIERNPEEQCPYVDVDWVSFFSSES